MVFKDYYKILDLQTSRVSIEDVKTAYRVAAKKYHPDVNVGDSLAEERIKDINEAYKILSVPASKRRYDRIWNYNVGRQQKVFNGKNDSASIFNIFLGSINKEEASKENSNQKPIRGEDVETQINISIYEAYNGTDKKIELKNIEGNSKTIVVTVPAGINNGEKIRLIGQGKNGKNGGKNGDFLIKINVEDNNQFKLKGNDIYTSLYITPWEAALGARVDLQSLEEQTQVYIPKGMQSGEIIKIPGKGFKSKNKTQGDLIAEVKIMVPKQLEEEEKKLFEKLNKVSKFNPRNT